MSNLTEGGGLPISPDTLGSFSAVIEQYRVYALLVLFLAIALALWKNNTRDLRFWLIWAVIAVCTGIIIVPSAKDVYSGVEVIGGTISQVPNQMFLYSGDRDGVFFARSPSRTYGDRSDYDWVRLSAERGDALRRLTFILDQNKTTTQRDANLQIVGNGIDRAPLRFEVVIPAAEERALRDRSLALALYTPSGDRPYILAGRTRFVGNVMNPNDPSDVVTSGDGVTPAPPKKTGFLLVAPAYADEPVETALTSDRIDQRAAGLAALQQQFDAKRAWMNQVLENPDSPVDLRLAVISTIRNHFKDDAKIAYPDPAQFRFLSPIAYNRIVLDGLDTTTALGVYSRLVLNNARDVRIDRSFDLIADKVFGKADQDHKSCLALFEIGVKYNWAFLTADQRLRAGQPITKAVLDTVLAILAQARREVPTLAGADRVQGARIDYLEGMIYGRVASAPAGAVARDIDRAGMTARSQAAFARFLAELPEGQRAGYRYQSHFGVAQAFLAKPDPAILETPAAPTSPERGCSDPGRTS